MRLPDDRQDVGERHVLVVRALVIAPAHVHAHALARDVDQRPIDRRHDALDEAEEFAERPVLIGDVALEREVGAVELQEEAVADDRLVLDPERVGERCEISLLGRVVPVLHRRGDDARRGRGQERLDEVVGLSSTARKSSHSALTAAGSR